MIKFLNLLKSHWKIILIILGGLICFALAYYLDNPLIAFLTGIFFAPSAVAEKNNLTKTDDVIKNSETTQTKDQEVKNDSLENVSSIDSDVSSIRKDIFN